MTEDTDPGDEDLTDLMYVGPATAEIIAGAGFDVEDIRDKRVSYRNLVDAGANAGVATKIRREHSLAWSITGETDQDLGKRSDQVRGLSDEERAWVSASSGDWSAEPNATGTTGDSAAEADGSGDAQVAEAAWRDRSKPTPVTDLDAVSEDDAKVLASAGINSVRSLATITPEHVADLLGLDEENVTRWRDEAVEEI
ncbi:MAG: helix-hairpin-helix domain-containing protein [Halobacteriales archaeon]